MGWWKIASVRTGGIYWGFCNQSEMIADRKPGRDSNEELLNGDGPADIMGVALDNIIEEYLKDWGRPPKRRELRAVFNFCMNGLDLRGRR